MFLEKIGSSNQDLGTGPDKNTRQTIELRFMSSGRTHLAILDVFTSSGSDLNCACDLKETDWIYNNLTTLALQESLLVIKRQTHFEIAFELGSKGFCETALENAIPILNTLGVYERTARDYLRTLGIDQETQVKYRGQWMSYKQYLLLTHPILIHRPLS